MNDEDGKPASGIHVAVSVASRESPRSPADPVLRVSLFGSFSATVNDSPLLPLRSRKGQWLLALLALRAGHKVERAWLAGTLWPDTTEANALSSLRQTLTDLRRALGPAAACIHSPTTRTLTFDASEAIVDVLAFDASVRQGDLLSLNQAVTLHERPFLEDCLEEWALPEREAREMNCLAARQALAKAAFAEGNFAAAVAHLRYAISADPFHEESYRDLMTVLARSGDWGNVVHAYRDLRLLLQRELRTEPAAETSALYRRLRAEAQGNVAEAVRDDKSGLTPPLLIGLLPRPLTELVGREQEIRDVSAMLLRSRLVTLTGPGGVGKTRLSIRVAEEWAADQPDGVWFADLAPVKDAALVPLIVAAVLGIKEKPDCLLTDTLAACLRERRLLLILDNCEHVLDVCTSLAASLLSDCPSLRIMTTSRHALRITGEAVFVVPSLSMPDPQDGMTVATLIRADAVRLFVERAACVLPGFTLTAENAQAVFQICQRLDGIPLALELAAARVRLLSPEQIAARLDDRFQLLTMGSRAALPRHQTLRALLDWSYDLLSEPERVLLSTLSVFSGGWTLAAAETVCAAECDAVTTLDLLTELEEQSLIVVDADSGPERRYQMLETVREYGRHRLEERQQDEAGRYRHREWCLKLAQEAELGMRGPEQARWLADLAREHDNFRAALLDFRTQGPARRSAEGGDTGLRLASALRQFWDMHGHYREGREWFQSLLAQNIGTPAERARALSNQGLLAMGEVDMAAAEALFKQSLMLFRQAGDCRGTADVLNNLGIVAWWHDDYARAQALYEESLATDRKLNDAYSAASVLSNLGLVAHCLGDYARARALLEESLLLRRDVCDQRGIANALLNLGVVFYDDSDDLHAASHCGQSLELFRTLGQKDGATVSLTYLGRVAARKGDLHRARVLYQEALNLARDIGDKRRMADLLGYLADAALSEQDTTHALALYHEQLLHRKDMGEKRMLASSFDGFARWAEAMGQDSMTVQFLAAAEALRTGTGAVLPRAESDSLRQSLGRLKYNLGAAAFAVEWEKGQLLPLEQTTELALELSPDYFNYR